MASIGTLWLSSPTSVLGKFLLGIAAQGDLKVDLPENYKHFEDNKKPEFLEKFPHGKVPAFEGKDGFVLFEQFAIARYFASLAPNSGLLGSTPQESAQVDQWTIHATAEIATHGNTAFQLCKGILPYNKDLHTYHIEQLIRGVKTVEAHLATCTFLVGERITVADIALASVLEGGFKTFIDASVRKDIPNTIRHFETVVNQPKLKDVLGGVRKEVWAEKAIQFTPPAKEKK